MGTIKWPKWIENIEVYRDGPDGRFCCTARVDDDAYWALGADEFIGWADTVEGAIRNAIGFGDARAAQRAAGTQRES